MMPVMEALLRRLERSPVASEWVLRGGLIMRHYSGPVPRPVEDIDFLALHPFDQASTAARIESIARIGIHDDIHFGALRSEVIWAETPFPGVRTFLAVNRAPEGAPAELRIDIGFGDPMDPPPAWIDYPTEGGAVRVLACRPETLLAWKVHGLFERGAGQWRPKDLFDIHLLATHAPLDRALIPRALRLAFDSRGDSLALTSRLVAGELGRSPWSREKWSRFRRSRPEGVPEELASVVAEVGAFLRPLVAAASAMK
jgi:hypothetical protein